VGAKGSRWNLLHVCAKYDAVECTKLLLKKTYQQDDDEYLQIINVRTAEGYTPLMIAIIYQANKTLQLLLRLGGCDLGIMESSKLRAYELALNYQNEIAIRELIVYEDRCKKHMFINKQELMEEIAVVEENSWFSSCVTCLVDYLLCLNRQEADS
jgi:ankyrin repeat protein